MTYTSSRKFKMAVIPLVAGAIFVSMFLPYPSTAQPRDWYVAPDGLASNDGSIAKPLDLATALNGRTVRSGTIWLRGGTYRGPFTSNLNGAPDAPITVRQYASERAIISDDRERGNGGTLNIRGSWTIYRDFEVTNANPERRNRPQFRPMGLEVQAPNTKLINLVIHDTGMGFGFWKEAVDAELYGNLIYNCGSANTPTDYHHGHAIYSQNNTGTKVIRDNILVNQYGFGIHIYPKPGDYKGYLIEGNVIAGSGASNPQSEGDNHYNNILVSGYKPWQADRIELVRNFTYLPRLEGKPKGHFTEANLCLGCTDPQTHESVVIKDNYFARGAPIAIVNGWQNVTMTGNTFVGEAGFTALQLPGREAPVNWTWDNNTYIGTGYGGSTNALFALNGKILGLREWTLQTGLDRNSKARLQLPSGLDVFVRPNQYERGRATIVVYNWDRQEAVNVDLGSVVGRNSQFEIVNAMDYFGEPVVRGTYTGGSVRLPMRNLPIAKPLGEQMAAISSGGEFNVFVVRSASGRVPEPTSQSVRPGVPSRGQMEPAQGRGTTTAPDLQRYQGEYNTRDGRARVRVAIDRVGGLLCTMETEAGAPSYRLTRVAADRFRLEGAPEGFYAEFRAADGRVASLTIERGRFPAVVLYPR